MDLSKQSLMKTGPGKNKANEKLNLAKPRSMKIEPGQTKANENWTWHNFAQILAVAVYVQFEIVFIGRTLLPLGYFIISYLDTMSHHGHIMKRLIESVPLSHNLQVAAKPILYDHFFKIVFLIFLSSDI